MFSSEDVEQVAVVAGGIGVVLRGDYPGPDAARRTRVEIELTWRAARKLQKRIETLLSDREVVT